MAGDAANFSTYDNVSSLDHFVLWAQRTAGKPNLRGGDRVVSQPWTKASVEIKDTATDAGDAVIPLRKQPISFEKASIVLESTELNVSSAPVDPDSKDVVKPEPEAQLEKKTLSSIVPLQQHELSQALQYPGASPKPSPVVSAAFRRSDETPLQCPSKLCAVNKLNETQSAPYLTPTQKKIIAEINAQDIEGVSRWSEPAVAQTPSKAFAAVTGNQSGQEQQMDSTTDVSHTGAANVHYGSTPTLSRVGPAAITPHSRDAAFGKKYDPMAMYEKLKKGFYPETSKPKCDPPSGGEQQLAVLNEQHVLIFDPATQESQVPEAEYDTVVGLPDSRRPDSIPDLTKVDKGEDDQDAKAESGIDLAPVLTALEARTPRASEAHSAASNTDSTLTPDGEAREANGADKPHTNTQHETKVVTEAEETLVNPGVTTVADHVVADVPVDESSRTAERQGHRTVVIKNLPASCDYTFVQSLVCGGTLDKIKLLPEQHAAEVTFAQPEECRRYFNSLQGGMIQFKHKRKQHTVYVELSERIEPAEALLQAYLDCGATRVVSAEEVDDELSMRDLNKLATGPSAVREIEMIVDSYRRGSRNVVFRFTNIRDAVAFKATHRGFQTWATQLSFVEDPCGPNLET
ncbi:hypothetical protein LTR05_001203 [Lithohypha guttulata]|uniref:RRM domain-containing protein n=1 Tax=Lithohypha guttulata TaxID=1690604 RepID=A0AAN7YK16_9EURO|nr:hypothetical protein LTR05_001203 [Lithohypha guttulata]